MAVYKIFPEKDATLYSLFPQMNTGLDEILDVSNLNFAVDSYAQAARYLVKFNQDDIDNVFEIVHWEYDTGSYEELEELRERYEPLFLNTD